MKTGNNIQAKEDLWETKRTSTNKVKVQIIEQFKQLNGRRRSQNKESILMCKIIIKNNNSFSRWDIV